MLELTNFSYANSSAFDLRIVPGQCAGLSGPSGSGKTRLLRAMCDLDPWQGSMQLAGVDAHSIPAPEWRQRIGYLPADALWWHDTVGPHFPYTSELPEKYNWEAAGFESDVTHWEISRLSSGERQRLAMLRLLCRRPHALLLDEPTAHLDPKSALMMEALVQNYQKTNNIPVLWVTHIPEQLDRITHSQYLMHHGIPEQQP
jgi:ABC-type multidrug transport system ATPase subunit